MKKLLLLLIFISSLKIFAQSEIQYIETVPESFKKKYFEEKHEYNPLHVGDLWQYSTSYGYENWLIVGDTLVGNRLYFRKKTNFATTWERNDTIKQSSYLLDLDDLDEDGNTNEELLLDSLEVPNFAEYISYRLITKDNLPDVPFEAFVEDSSWAIIFEDTVITRRVQYLCCFTTQIVADKFGVDWSMTEGPPIILSGAIINGITYGLIVSVNDEHFPVIPDKLILSQNYPNPFNPSTTIKFVLNEFNSVTVKVYNILGKDIKLLLEEDLSAGEYNIQWNGKDDEGNTLSGGIYFIRMIVGRYQKTIKTVFLK